MTENQTWLTWIDRHLVSLFETAAAGEGDIPMTVLTVDSDNEAKQYHLIPAPTDAVIARVTVGKIIEAMEAVRFGVLSQYTINPNGEAPVDIVSIVACDEWHAISNVYEVNTDDGATILLQSDVLSPAACAKLAANWAGLVGQRPTPQPN